MRRWWIGFMILALLVGLSACAGGSNDDPDGDAPAGDGDSDDPADGDVPACSGSCEDAVTDAYCLGSNLCVCQNDEWTVVNCSVYCLNMGRDVMGCAIDAANGFACICGSEADGDIPDGDEDSAGDQDSDSDETDGDEEKTEYGEYDEPSLFAYPDDAFDELCGENDPVYGDEIELAYEDGNVAGTMAGSYDWNDEAIHFIPDRPMRIKKVRMRFNGMGTVAVRLTRDIARSNPNLDLLLAPEKQHTISPDEMGKWVEIDFSDDDVVVHPRDHFWVVYRHLAPQPLLLLGDKTDTFTHSMLRSDVLIAEWRAENSAFVWAGGPSNVDYIVRVVVEPFCEADTRFFTDISAETAVLEPTREDTGLTIADVKENRVSFVDLNQDLWPDFVLHETANGVDDPDRVRVLLNNGANAFIDDTAATGLNGHYTVLMSFGDINNDGYLDAYGGVYTPQDNPEALVDGDADDESESETDGDGEDAETAMNLYKARDLILLNDGSGAFSPLPDSGVEETATTSGAGLADYNHDGNLDLYEGNWLVEYPKSDAMLDLLFEGAGDGTFTEVSDDMGISYIPQRFGLACYGVTWCDWNDDGWMDILVANYGYDPNLLWKNNAGQGFSDVGVATGLARDGVGGSGGNTFGIDCGDFNNDGYQDVFLAEIAHPRYQPDSDPSRLMRNLGSEGDYNFEDLTRDVGIYYDEGEIDASWGDFDNDGDLDLVVASLYTLHFARLYRQEWDGSFSDISYEAGINAHDAVGTNWADIDRDGDLDLAVARRGTGAHLHLFRNEIGSENHWLQIRLEGCAGTDKAGRDDYVCSNRSAIGAKITVTAGDLVMVREVRGGKGHFNQQHPFVQHFGLGEHETIDSIKVRWPNGDSTTFDGPISVDQFLYGMELGGDLVVDPLIVP